MWPAGGNRRRSPRDITERKRADRVLRESQEQLQRVIEGSKDGFWDWNVTTNHVTFSGRWASMLGYRVDELGCQYETWENLTHLEDRFRVLEALAESSRRPIGEFRSRISTSHQGWQMEMDSESRTLVSAMPKGSRCSSRARTPIFRKGKGWN